MKEYRVTVSIWVDADSEQQAIRAAERELGAEYRNLFAFTPHVESAEEWHSEDDPEADAEDAHERSWLAWVR